MTEQKAEKAYTCSCEPETSGGCEAGRRGTPELCSATEKAYLGNHTKLNADQPERCPSIDPYDTLQCGRRIHEDDQCVFGGIGWKKGTRPPHERHHPWGPLEAALVTTLADWKVVSEARPASGEGSDCSDLMDLALTRIKGLCSGALDPEQVMAETVSEIPSPPGQSGTEGDPMTATEGCIDTPHDHVDQCHRAGRAEVEAKYAALVAAVEGLAADLTEEVDELRADIPPVGPSRVAHAYRAAGLSDARDRLRTILADLADPAEGGDR